MTKTHKIIFSTLITLTSLVFIMGAYPKLVASPESVQGFAEIGLPIWVMYIVGIGELLGAIGIWLGKTRILSLIGLAIIMIGAVVIVGTTKSLSMTIIPLVVLIFLATIYWLNKKNTVVIAQ